MNRNIKKALKSAFHAPPPTRKLEFLSHLPYPNSTNVEFHLSQIGYIRKSSWILSALFLLCMAAFSLFAHQDKRIVGIVSSCLPLLALIGITEISKSMSYHMAELEMGCKHSLSEIILIRLYTLGAFHFIILLLLLFLFKNQSPYGMFRYSLYIVTPFLLSSYLSFWMTNHIRTRDTLYLCCGVAIFISVLVFLANSMFTVIYEKPYTPLWSMACVAIITLLIKELYFLLTERNEEWNFA